jgi:hypothetical protein
MKFSLARALALPRHVTTNRRTADTLWLTMRAPQTNERIADTQGLPQQKALYN